MYDPNTPSKLKHYGVIERKTGQYDEVAVLGCSNGAIMCVILDALPAHEHTELRRIIESPLSQKLMYLAEHLNTIPFNFRGGHTTWFEEILRKYNDRKTHDVYIVPAHNVRGLNVEQKAEFLGYGGSAKESEMQKIGQELTPELEEQIINRAKENGLYDPTAEERAKTTVDSASEIADMRDMISQLAASVGALSQVVAEQQKPARKAPVRKRATKKTTSEA